MMKFYATVSHKVFPLQNVIHNFVTFNYNKTDVVLEFIWQILHYVILIIWHILML